MESESENEVKEGLENPEVDRGSKAEETYEQSTNGIDPEQSNDLNTDQLDSLGGKCREPNSQSSLSAENIHKPFEVTTAPADLLHLPPTHKGNAVQLGGISFERKRLLESPELRHLNCRLSAKELKTMSLKLKKISLRYRFLLATYYKGDDPDQTMNAMLTQDQECEKSKSETPDLNEDRQDIGKLPNNETGLVLNRSTYTRHPDCKHSLEELRKMSSKLNNHFMKKYFLYLTYCEGVDPDQEMEELLSDDYSWQTKYLPQLPWEELKKISQILPTSELRHTFLRLACTGRNPEGLLQYLLSKVEVRKLLFEKHLKVHINEAQIKVYSNWREQGFCEEGALAKVMEQWNMVEGANQASSNVTTSSIAGSSNKDVQNDSQDQLKLNRRPKKRQKETRARKFTHFNEDQMKLYNSWRGQGMAHRDSVRKVLEQCGLSSHNSQKGISPSVKSANQPSKASATILAGSTNKDTQKANAADSAHQYNLASSKKATMSRKQWKHLKDKRAKQFKTFNEGEMKMYNTWLAQGLTHIAAVTKVVETSLRRASKQKPSAKVEPLISQSLPLMSVRLHTEDRYSRATPGRSFLDPHFRPSSSYNSGIRNEVRPHQHVPPGFSGMPPVAVSGIRNDVWPRQHIPRDFSGMPPVAVSGIRNDVRPRQHIPRDFSGMPSVAVSGSSSCLKRKESYYDPGLPKRSRFVEQFSDPPIAGKLQRPDLSSGETLLSIVPSGYPAEHLSVRQMDAIENSILEAILEITDERMKPTFKGASRTNGRYEIVCKNELSNRWLYKHTSRMCQIWPNAFLKIIPGAKPVAKLHASAVLPLCKYDDDERILKFISNQNTGMNVDQWEVVQRRDDDSTYLRLLVDEASASVLKRCSTINFKLESAEIVFEGPPNRPGHNGQMKHDGSYSYPPGGPTASSRFDPGENLWQARSERTFVEPPSVQQTHATRRLPTSGGHFERDCPPCGPMYPSRLEHHTRSRLHSPPPIPPTLCRYFPSPY